MLQGKIGIFYNKYNPKTSAQVSFLLQDRRMVDAVSDPNADFDAVLMLGGDGLALRAMHTFCSRRIPFYGINYGTLGFFMNDRLPEGASHDDYIAKIHNAAIHKLNPLRCKVISRKRSSFTLSAFNDIIITRISPRATRLSIAVNGLVKIEEMIGDGIVVSTPVGSSGYNFSLRGPILPINSGLLALTPAAPLKPRAWSGAILSDSSTVSISILPSSEECKLSADGVDYHDINVAEIELDKSQVTLLLFDKKDSLEEKSMNLIFPSN